MTLNIVCLNAGNYEGRGKEYVEILHDMVTRNIPKGTFFNFICFTDDPEPYNSEIQKRPLEGTLTGWWNKLYLFKDGLFPEGDRILYFDLDTCITSGLDEIIKYDGPFAILRDVYRPGGLQSSVMAWQTNTMGAIWSLFEGHNFPNIDGGDQAWLEKYCGSYADILQTLYPNCFYSYKQSCQFDIPKSAKVVFFHGLPRPHECESNWVPFVWKIGGGSSIEFEIIGNVTDQELTANVDYALTLPYETIAKCSEPHDGILCIIGGGPSLADDLEEIRGRYKGGAVIWALNNSFKYLRDNGIEAHGHVMLDAREKNVEFVLPSPATRIYASTVHPEVFKAAKLCGGEILLWHPMIAGMLGKLENKPAALIGCGNSVGLKAMGLAMVMGFRDVHLYGYDSSYRGDANHAYSQPLNDNERIIEVQVNGRKFKTAPWMAMQTDEFKETCKDLCENHGMKFVIHGDGLLPYVASLLYSPSAVPDEIVEKDGIWWPKEDYHCQQAMQGSMKDVECILKYVKSCGVVVQAGGNVGMWPREFAKHFQKVLTFEPDKTNLECLVRNCPSADIVKINAGLGDKPSRQGMHRFADNCGAHFMVEGDEIEIKTIDSLDLTVCDLIQLDVEGFEYQALRGAEKTIKRFHPVIVTEEKGLGLKYQVEEHYIRDFLLGLGYKIAERVNNDVIYTYGEQ